MARDWYNDVARRPGGYSVFWRHWVEGPDAQRQFDELVFAHARQKVVLDCGCGDGAFTFRVAAVAQQVVGLDYAEAMLANATRVAQAEGIANIAFVHAHARDGNPLPPETFDLAYTRRGPNLLTKVPALVKPGGLLLGIHPLDEPADAYAAQIEAAGLRLESCRGFDDLYHFPTLDDLAGYLNRQPGMPDVRLPEHRELLLAKAAALQTANGDYVVQHHYIVWAARTTAPQTTTADG